MNLLIFIIFLLSCNKNIVELATKNKVGETYWQYIERDEDDKLRAYLELQENKNLDLNETNKDESNEKIKGETPLTLATKCNSRKVVNLLLNDNLLKQKIDINLRNSKGQAALIASILNNSRCIKRDLIIKKLLNSGADVNVRYGAGCSTLMLAISEGDTNTTKEILNKGIDINAQNLFGETALILAIKHNIDQEKRKEIIKALLDRNINLNIQDKDGRTALIHSVLDNNQQIFEMLIAKDILDINLCDDYGRTALIYSVLKNNHLSCELLLNKPKILHNYVDIRGNTAFMYALRRNYESIVEFFIAKSRNDSKFLSQKENFCLELYTYLKEFKNSELQEEKASLLFNKLMLLDKKIEEIKINEQLEGFQNFWGFSLNRLLKAACENIEFFFLLLDNKLSNLYHPKTFLNKLTKEAFKKNNLDLIAKLLVKYPYFFSSLLYLENRNIFFSLLDNYNEIKENFESFIQSPASKIEQGYELFHLFTFRDEDKKTFLNYIEERGYLDLSNKIKEKISLGFSVPSSEEFKNLYYLLLIGNEKDFNSLLKNFLEEDSENLNAKIFENESTILMCLIKNKNFEDMSLEIIKDRKFQLKIREADKNGQTLLHYAASAGAIKIIEELIKIDPDLSNISDKSGVTPLIEVVTSDISFDKKCAIIDLLFSTKILRVNDREFNDGLSPLMFCAHMLDYKMLKKLLSLGKKDGKIIKGYAEIVDINIKDAVAKNALSYILYKKDEILSKNKNTFKIIKELLAQGIDIQSIDVFGNSSCDCAKNLNDHTINILFKNIKKIDIGKKEIQEETSLIKEIFNKIRNHKFEEAEKDIKKNIEDLSSEIISEAFMLTFKNQVAKKENKIDNIGNPYSHTTYNYAYKNYYFKQFLNFLLNTKKLNINFKISRSSTPFHKIITYNLLDLFEAVLTEYKEEIDLDIKNYMSKSYLHYAAENSNQIFLEKLLSNFNITKEYINHRDIYGYTALMIAVQEENVENGILLLMRSADPNIRDIEEGKTALMIFIEEFKNNIENIMRHPTIRKFLELILSKSNLSIMNKKGETALDIALKFKCKELATEMSLYNSLYDNPFNVDLGPLNTEVYKIEITNHIIKKNIIISSLLKAWDLKYYAVVDNILKYKRNVIKELKNNVEDDEVINSIIEYYEKNILNK